MEIDLAKCVREILKGKASAQAAQACLSRLTSSDLKRLIPENELRPLLEAYKERNNYGSSPLIKISEQEAKAMWQQFATSVSRKKGFGDTIWRWIGNLWTDLYVLFTRTAVGKLGLAAALLVLVLAPILMQSDKPGFQSYRGEKGLEASVPAVLQFSLLESTGKLLRPDRLITEKDTLAFRIKANKEGFCSIYIGYNDRIDRIMSDRLLTMGIHDLDVAYTLSGNRGVNRLIMLFAEAPIAIEEAQKQRLLLEATRNGLTSMTIGDNTINISSQRIEVH
jgi:hypothetical protein